MELILEHVSKSFKKQCVVNDINLILDNGIHGLLGANGSGKTTLLRMICGILPMDKGTLTLDGMDAFKQYDIYTSNIGYMPQHFGFYPHYSVYEFLEYMAILKNLSKEYTVKRINELLTLLNLQEKRNTKMKKLSGGMLRRVGIIQALLNEPKILILDEPTAGLDPKERIIFRNLIASLSNECIIILSTHIVSDIESIADDIIVMKEGQLILHDTPETLLDTMTDKVWKLTLNKDESQIIMDNYIIVKSHHIHDKIELRIVSDTSPHPDAIHVQADLDDLYLYHFKEGDTL